RSEQGPAEEKRRRAAVIATRQRRTWYKTHAVLPRPRPRRSARTGRGPRPPFTKEGHSMTSRVLWLLALAALLLAGGSAPAAAPPGKAKREPADAQALAAK